jgi:hypothetical protein
MGLDMYLTAEKYMSNYFDSADGEKITKINEIFNLDGGEDRDYSAQSVIFRVAYWRKANAIHQWFVENVQNGVDECQKAYVEREQLEKLLDICKQILEKPKKASELLPTQGGFFFGSTDYGEYYMQDIQDTADRLTKILNDPVFKTGMDFYYQSSW